MNDGLKAGERRLIVKDHRSKRVAIDLAVRCRAGKSPFDHGDGFALIERVHDGV
jgi:hypothetical protein